MNKKSILIFTISYPYGTEESFLHTELGYISQKFEHIFLFPMSCDDSLGVREIPANAKVINLFNNSSFSLSTIFPSNIILFIRLFFSQFFAGNLFTTNPKFKVSQIFRVIYKSKLIGAWIATSDLKLSNLIFYTYWFSEWATLIALQNKEEINQRFFSRAHGFDIYEIQGNNRSIPYRRIQLKSVNTVFTVSDDGQKHITKKYPTFKKKIKVSRLGTKDGGLGPFDENQLRIVSCSSLIPLKRVDRLVEILSFLTLNVEWVHFGNGPEFKNIEKQASELPENIKVNLRGFVENSEILDYYKNNSVSLFINLSFSEGVPVSIMEAISFGIPILATDVGGVSEVVPTEFCKLIPSDFESETVAAEITTFFNSDRNTAQNRAAIRKFWEQNYSAELNYDNFQKMINIH